MKALTLFACIALLFSCSTKHETPDDVQVLSPDLRVERLTDHVYLHVSMLQTDNFGKVACNGLVYIKNNEALVFDTPTNDSLSELLIAWIEEDQNAAIKGLIVNHFHVDCTGGIEAFHQHGIASYGSKLTQEIAIARGEGVVQKTFSGNTFKMTFHNGPVAECHVLGEAHTIDNIVTYLPKEKVLFGGCMIKSLTSGKGNLADATPGQWSRTVQHVKDAFPNASVIVPGHGKPGGTELLDYTIAMFKNSQIE